MWQFGKETYEAFLQLAVDEEVGDYTDISEGRDIKLVTVGPESTGTKYNRTTISPSMRNSELGSADQVKIWLENQPNPKDLFKPFSFDEMKAALQNWLNPSEEGETVVEEEKEQAPKTNYSLNTSSTNVKQSKLDKFNDIFEEDSDMPF